MSGISQALVLLIPGTLKGSSPAKATVENTT